MKIIPINCIKNINSNNKNKKYYNKVSSPTEKVVNKPALSMYSNYVSNISFASGLGNKDKVDNFFDKYFVEPAKKGATPSSTLIIAPQEKIAQDYYKKLALKTNMKYKEILVFNGNGEQLNDKLYKKLQSEAMKAKQQGVPTLFGINLDLIQKENGQIPQKYKEFFENIYKKYNCVVGVYGTSIKDVKTDSLSVFRLFVPIGIEEKINMAKLNPNAKIYSPIPQQSISKIQKANEISSMNAKSNTSFIKSLDEFQLENVHSIDILQQGSTYSVDSILDIEIGTEQLVDYWLKLSGKNPEEYTSRLKKMWLNEILNDENQTKKLIANAIERLRKIGTSVELAQVNYADILENESDLTDEQKAILQKQQNSSLFYFAVSSDMCVNSSFDFQSKTISILTQLAKENELVKSNALNTIFIPASRTSILESENSDDIEVVNYVLDLINQKAQKSSELEKKKLNQIISVFYEAQQNGDLKEFYSNWKQIVGIAKDYFNSEVVDDITNRNLELIISIKQKIKNVENKRVLDLVNDSQLTIEQKEFVLRYGQNRQFISMINNSNVDVVKTIAELVFFEAANRSLNNQYSLNLSDGDFDTLMSDKFHQIDSDNRDINIQGNKISSKLDGVNASVLNFADKFSNYAVLSLDIQSQGLHQLIKANGYLSSINNNTEQIRQYSQAITRTKLLELEKDKYYKDIVPEIVKLLPETEQLDIKEFLAKVDDLAKAETNIKRKKAIMKAGAIIAGTVVASVGIYYFGPAVVAHLASGLASDGASTLALSTAIAQVNNAKKIGNSALISFLGRSPDKISDEIRSVEHHIKFLKDMIRKFPNDPKYAHELVRYQKKLKELLDELADSIK